jgi:DNA repair protein RadC
MITEPGTNKSQTPSSKPPKPRSKLLHQGLDFLSDVELIAITLGPGTKKPTTTELAQQILHSVDFDLHAFGKLTLKDLTKFNGLGLSRACTLVASVELGRRIKESQRVRPTKITSSKDAADIFQSQLQDLKHEEFWIAMLNRANHFISKHQISKGGVAGTLVDLKIIFKTAIDNLASSIILCHNHPSGITKPSDADIKLTKRIKESGTLLDISVLDHIIIADTNYFSFADEGMM